MNSRKFGCNLIPVLDAHVDDYRKGAFSAHIHKSNSGGAIRITLGDLLNDSLKDMLSTLMASIGIAATDCILVVDLSDAAISDSTTFSKFVAEWLSKLHDLGRWKRMIVEASSYPTKNPAKPNSEKKTPRSEWLSWMQLVQHDRSILEWASFGDFGADHGQIDFDGAGRTVTHLRYATATDWIVGRGGDAIEGHDGTIHTVAKKILSAAEFMGEDYSAGDEFIARCADKDASGNGSTWRWANMVHHMTLVTSSVGELIGVPVERPKRSPRVKQLSLLTSDK